MITDILIWFFMVLGLFFCTVGVYGVFKLPEVYTKQHATGLIETAGIFFIMLSLAISSGFVLVSIKPILLAVLVAGFSAPACYAFMQVVIRKKGDLKPSKEKKDV
jgi:multicomponent Na+:H+ antiporter subunit G